MNINEYKDKYKHLANGEVVTNNLSRKQKYDNYIKSDYWKKRSKKLRNRRRCKDCRKNYDLTVHHKSYASLFQEKVSHLEVLCWECHKKRHPEKRR